MNRVSAIVLTYNESKHIKRCIESLQSVCEYVYIIDSYSTDNTVEIAKSLGAHVYTVKWENSYSIKFNWALENIKFKTEWLLRLDADEYLTDLLQREIADSLPRIDKSVTGLLVKRRMHFLGKWISHGDCYPIWLLRIWRAGMGKCESRWMDEHIKLSGGNVKRLNNDIVDDNKSSLIDWTNKHTIYAVKDAIDILDVKYQFCGETRSYQDRLEGQANYKRYIKEKYYSRLPLFARAWFFFIYRYFFRLGFLDGYPGFIRQILQTLWYRNLVDAYIYEINCHSRKYGISVANSIYQLYSIDVTKMKS